MTSEAGHLWLWGKTASLPDDRSPRALPLIHHMLDVAAVAQRLIVHDTERFRRMAARLGVDPEELARLTLWLVAMHDIGKASIGFQQLSPEHWCKSALGVRPAVSSGLHHGDLTAWYFGEGYDGGWNGRSTPAGPLRATLMGLMPDAGDSVAHVVGAVAGHHGRPVDPNPNIDAGKIGAGAIDAAKTIANELAKLFEVEPVDADWRAGTMMPFVWYLATLTPLADWIGSNQTWFPIGLDCLSLADYWSQTQARARTALAEAGLVPAPVAPVSPARTLPDIAVLSPAQQWAATVPLATSGPMLAVIEDATGSGKTEAALLLAHRMMAADLAQGLYMALPTMATANAMYERLGAVYRNMFDQVPSEPGPALSLIHGRSHLGDSDSGPVSAWCSEWIASDRRKRFFAQAGAGTVDQAILAVLASRYQTLRLRGLAGKVLVIDEAHAFDAYVSTEIEALLRFHAAQGAPAIILSATLPQSKRAALIAAYAEGAGWDAARSAPRSDAFPLGSVATESGVAEQALETRASDRRVIIERISSVADGEAVALAAARQGAAVALIRSTVDDAIESYEQIRQECEGEDQVEPTLFHARFLPDDRAKIERRVMASFGKNSEKRRRGQLLVATAVIEQSLDLDFDVMITDLAPIDLLIQRAGRLWRHERGDRPAAAPVLRVISPPPPDDPLPEWLDADLPHAVWVYRDPSLLWHSARAAFRVGAFETRTLADREPAPAHPRRLVEEVYGEIGNSMPSHLVEAADTAWAEALVQKEVARRATLSPSLPYEKGNAAWDDEAKVRTRLGDSMTVCLAREEAGMLMPLHGDRWETSELRLGVSMARGLKPPDEIQRKRLRPQWTGPDAGILLLVMYPEEGGGWVDGDDGRRYDKELGLASPKDRG